MKKRKKIVRWKGTALVPKEFFGAMSIGKNGEYMMTPPIDDTTLVVFGISPLEHYQILSCHFLSHSQSESHARAMIEQCKLHRIERAVLFCMKPVQFVDIKLVTDKLLEADIVMELHECKFGGCVVAFSGNAYIANPIW